MSQEVYQPKLAREGKRPWRIVGAHEQQSASGAAAPRDIAIVQTRCQALALNEQELVIQWAEASACIGGKQRAASPMKHGI